MAINEPELTDRQHELLGPHAKHYYDMGSFVRKSSLKHLEELLATCKLHGTTNCGWAASTLLDIS
jgi:hypothetical protein